MRFLWLLEDLAQSVYIALLTVLRIIVLVTATVNYGSD